MDAQHEAVTAATGQMEEAMATGVTPAPAPATEVATPPEATSLTPSPSPPVATPAAAAPTAPALPPEIAERLARAQELERQMQQLQLAAAEAQRQQAQQRLFEHIRERMLAAYQMAESLPEEEGKSFITRSIEALTNEMTQGLQELQRQQAEQVQSLIRVVAAPAYAHHLAQTHGLPASAVEELQQFAPEQMDQAAQMIKRRLAERQPLEEELRRLREEIDQIKRGHVAQQVAETGAHVSSGTNAMPMAPNADVEPGSLAHLAALLPPRFLG